MLMNSSTNLSGKRAAIAALSLVVLLFGSCLSITAGNNCTLKAVQLITSFPVFSASYELINADDTLTLFSYKQFRMLQIQVVSSESRTFLDKEGNLLREELVNTEIKHKYLVFEQGNPYGLMYDSLNAEGYRYSVDSFLMQNTITNLSPFVENLLKGDSLVEKKKLTKDVLLEKYVPKVKKDASYSDSAFLYFSAKLNNIDFSFSEKLDKLKKSKLYKLRLVYNNNPNTSDNFGKLAKEFLFELATLPVKNKSEIIAFFETRTGENLSP